MLIGLIASDCQWCQRAALQEGFEALGHTVTTDWSHPDVAFVFVGNPPYDPTILAAACAKSKKIILNVLDLPVQNPDGMRWINEWATQLPLAARVTSISRYTQSQLKKICGIESEVIYYPMKRIEIGQYVDYPQYKFLLSGRVNDRNKRFHVALGAILGAGFDKSQVAIVGPENPGWGDHLGVVNDQTLNDLHNAVDYVMMPSYIEGLGLPAIQAACAATIPIVLPDLSTYDELWAGSPMGLFYRTFIDVESIEQFLIYMEENPAEKAIMKDAMYAYAQSHLAPLFDRVEVAKRIISIYHSIGTLS